MKCPVLTHDEEFVPEGIKYIPKDCLKEECAVWDEDKNQCPILSILGALVALNSILTEIAEEMPREEQFRK